MFDNFPLWPARASTTAGNVDALYIFLVVLSTFMSVAIFVMILAFAARYRRRPGHAAEQIEGSTILEITWSVIPFGIFVVIFVWGAVIFFQERTPPRGATEIYVVAKQWMWKLEHEEGHREINELHVPVGRDVKMILTSTRRHPQFLCPSISYQTGRGPRPLHHRMVPSYSSRNLPSILRGILRNTTLRHDWTSRGYGTFAVSSLAQRRRNHRLARFHGTDPFPATRLQHLSQAGYPGKRPQPGGKIW